MGPVAALCAVAACAFALRLNGSTALARDGGGPAECSGHVTLGIDLQEGFEGTLVAIRVNGDEVYRKDGVRTRKLLGYADALQVQVPVGPITVEVDLPREGMSSRLELDVRKDLYLGLSIRSGRIEHVVSERPFGYA
jgi:hypothetical protein